MTSDVIVDIFVMVPVNKRFIDIDCVTLNDPVGIVVDDCWLPEI
jgi:hypothetical protein